jgi:hypothetical protein
MSFLKSKHNGWLSDGTRTPFSGGGSGGGGGPTTTNVQNSNIPEYARPYVETMLGTAQQQIYNYGEPDAEGNRAVTGFKPYIPYGATVDAKGNITNTAQEQANAAVAGFSPLQRQAQYNVGQLRVPGQFDTGTGFTALGGIGAANIANRAAGAGQQYNEMATNPFAQQAFMSPYIQNALQPQLQEMQRQYDITGLQERGKAVGAGAFGGTRNALMQAENQRNKNIAMNQAIGSGYQDAFKSAQQAQQFGANLGLQGYGTALQGTGQLGQAGKSLADIGGQQLQAQQGILGLQSQFGGQQQALEQQKVNQAIQNYAMQQQYPNQQLSFMSGLLRGLPLQSATTQSYQAAPSAISQISGLGLTGAAAYGMMKKEGGIIKSYAEGGAVEGTEDFANGGITRDVLLNPDKYSAQMIDRSTKNGVIDDIVGLAALQQKNQEVKDRQAAAAMAQGKPPTVKDQIIAEAKQLQGIDTAQSNLPTEYAGGGIVAFSNGGSSSTGEFDIGNDPTALALDEIRREKIPKRMSYPEMLGYTKPEAAPAAAPAKPALEKPKFIDDAPKDKSPAAPPAPPAAAPTSPALDTSGTGIDDLIRQISGDMRTNKEASKDARKEAKLMAMLQAGLGIMGGTSQYAAANFKGAIPALQGYQEEMRGIRGDEAKQIAQLAALNLKGAELKQELKKLGITKERYDSQNREEAAKIGLYGAQEDYFRRRPGTSGSAGLGGAIPPSVSRAVKQEYNGYINNPKSAPFFSSLPKNVQTGLTDYGIKTKSYQDSLAEFKKFANQEMMNELGFYGALNVRSRPSSSVDLD